MFKKLKYFFLDYYHRPSAKFYSFFVFFKKALYNKRTIIISEKTFLLKDPPKSMRYFNYFGRSIYVILNIISIVVFRKFLDNSLSLKEQNLSESVGNDNSTWPNQAYNIFEDEAELQDEFYELIQNEYFKSVEVLKKNDELRDSQWWSECRQEFSKIFFENKKINKEKLKNFRNNSSTKAEILKDQNYLSHSKSKIVNMINSIKLVNLYHKLSINTDLSLLRKASESKVGNNFCPIYRNQRLSHRILRYAYYSSSIKNKTNLNDQENNIFLDIGGGYGGLSRSLKYIYRNSTFVIIELPELAFLASYFLKKCFTNSKIGTYSDFENNIKISKTDLSKFDFVILPQNCLDKFENDIIDMSINTTSLGEMTDETQDFYLNHIERITKKYFYSVNRSNKRKEKYNSRGFYQFKFNKKWDCILYNFTHTYHIEFLGYKL